MSASVRLDSSKGGTNTFEIQPVLGAALPEVASFVHSWEARRDQRSPIERISGHDPPSIERRLRWLLIENPLTKGASQHGLCVRTPSGDIVGLLLEFPGAFLAGDQRLLGLGSGGFFVEPHARTLGFHLFKRYLNTPGYAFFYSTTCNVESGALWKALAACALPKSDTGYILPLRLDVMLPALLAGRTSSTMAAGIAHVVGRCADPILQRFGLKSADLSVEPCRDWEKLGALFRRQRSAQLITTDRSPIYLQWRYGPSSPMYPVDTCVFRDKRGNEGWFALGSIRCGRQAQIRGCLLLDVIWPREVMRFKDILRAILQRVDSRVDALFFTSRPGLDFGESHRWVIACRLDAPTVFAVARKGRAPLAAFALDLVPADGDSAL